jgi:hypothetical protein
VWRKSGICSGFSWEIVVTAWRRGVILYIKARVVVSVCSSPAYGGKQEQCTPHIQDFKWSTKTLKGMSGKARKSAIGGLILHRYMRKGKRPPSHTHLPNVTKSVFAFSSYAYKILATLQPSIPTPGVEISQAHLDAWSQAPQNLNLDIWNHLPPPPPLLFNFLCTYTTYSAWVGHLKATYVCLSILSRFSLHSGL